MQKRAIIKAQKKNSSVKYLLLAILIILLIYLFQISGITGEAISKKVSRSKVICTDSDGLNPIMKGTCSSNKKSFTDSCISQSKLNEFLCSNSGMKGCTPTTIDCTAYGMTCKNGACV